MKRKGFLLATFFFVLQGFLQAQTPQGPIRCGTMQHLNYLISKDSGWITRLNNLEQAIQNNILHKQAVDTELVSIPIVVHVVYNQDSSSQNISDSQIQSQITILNQDFERMLGTPGYNTDPVGADARIRFSLATFDANGNPTTGITRTSTLVDSFSLNDDVKFTSRGGIDAWDRTRFLNIWVCRLGDNILGYAHFRYDSLTG